ncbi:NAD(P)/FAD-dependent oxidoreductase [Nitratidesulfovibrio sp. SRB-5]|uniref:NAD(P)/FAD-dependent oxidoreductase n=1 Tax=Nitratidesulfovibrio sp. SRB-5 TaxID=2872636 RepID=UPI0010258B67|nr:FAD-dependent oxidoreductase [Nitratidesulfovibrio sp. SRB-5]MBZ2170492.1 FAD-dependent oxidoreductase [Nitratidesulfovibrio sp. SRB-5]RXF78028.1 pyridine nucleotide-disulfide oxidoreductase [Desulfovibrio sp. DS-1]
MARLLLLGAGHAHLDAIRAIPALVARGHTVTVAGPGPCHCYSGMGPGVLGGTYAPQAMALPVRRMVQAAGGTFVTDTAVRIDAPGHAVHFASGLRLEYEVCSCNVGSLVAHILPGGDGVNGSTVGAPPSPVTLPVLSVKPIENLYRARQTLLRLAAHGAVDVLVAGGGPAALEVACNAAVCLARARGNAAPVVPGGDSVTLVAGRGLLPGLPERARDLCRTVTAARGVRIIEGARVLETTPEGALLDDGRSLPAHVVLLATGVAPPPLFAASGLIGRANGGPDGEADGGLAVNAHLQSIAHPDLFGGGDCIHFTPAPLPRVGVHAVRQGPVLAANLGTRLDAHARHAANAAPASGQPPLVPYIPRPGHLLVLDTGAGTGVLHRPLGGGALCFGGRLAFLVKRAIDTRFLRSHLPPGGTLPGECPWDAPA